MFEYLFRCCLDDNLQGWSSDQHSTKFSGEKAGSFSNAELISRIDQKLKEHADVLLHSVECLSARLSQMESRTRQVENNFDDLKESIEFNHGRTDRKLKELENILIEVWFWIFYNLMVCFGLYPQFVVGICMGHCDISMLNEVLNNNLLMLDIFLVFVC